MNKSSKKSGAGEVAAVGGYLKQYEYSACCLYRLMQDGALEAITIAEASAGIFDDLLVHTRQEVHATQVKSQKDAKYIALAQQLTANELVRKMADSWLVLEKKFCPGKIKLKYIFAGLFSKSDTSLSNPGSTGARHSAEFARFISTEDLSQDLVRDSVWSTKLRELQSLSGLDEEQFLRFLTTLKLCDGIELARNRIEYFPFEDRQRIEEIRDLFPALVSEAASKQKWSEEELIEKLGWRTRPSQKNIHQFPVPPDFQENVTTGSKLLDAVRHATSGYLALVGPPGTGKSTLLQRSIYSTSDYSVSRYLAFHPDQRHGLGRAEAGEFLNDLIAELRSQGFFGSRFAQDNLSGLRSELGKQLDRASQRFRESGRKTVIVIDGLDHVPREENPDSSFLKELPAANSVPDGVLFLLGTQRIDLADLHATIAQLAKEPTRCISIEPLSRNAIFEMADAANLPSFVEREEVYEACQGHPLTACYFLEALKSASSFEDASRILSLSDGLGRSLEQIYERVWIKLGTADASKSALGILARAEGSLLPEQLAAVSSDAAVEDVLQNAGFLLSRSRDGRLAIFHNSFRLFVAGETGKRFGKPDQDIEESYNRSLAGIAEAAPEEDPQHWMELRYRARARDNAAVLRIGTPDYFRRSLAAFRPSSEISNDLRLTYAAVRPTRDRVALLNKLLIAKEIEYRLEAVSDLDLVGLFLDLGDVKLATKHALEVDSSGDGWLRLVDHLWEAADYETARQVFEANEPLDVLLGGQGVDPHQDLDRAQEWIERAQRFRSVDKLVAIVDSLPVNSWGIDNDDVTASTRKILKHGLALGVVMDQRDADIRALQHQFSLDASEVAMLTVEAAVEAFHDGDHEAGLARLREAEAMPDLAQLDSSWRSVAAILAERIGAKDIASRLAATLSVPRIDEHRSELGVDGIDDRCQVVYETTVLGELTGTAIPEEQQSERGERSTLLAGVHNKVRELGVLRAMAKVEDAAQSAAALKRIILFFDKAKAGSGDFQAYKFYGTLGWLADPIFRIARELGGDALKDIIAFVDEKIAEGESNLSHSESFRLRFAALVFDVDSDAASAKKRIESAQAAIPSSRTPQEVVELRADFARAFNNVGLKAEAQASLQAMHQDTFGYWLRAKKEPQYTFWAWSFLKACEASPARTETNALEFAQFILGMDRTEGAETAIRLVPDLLQGAGGVPRAAAGITSRLIDSDLATWAKLADAALASIAKHDVRLSAPALQVFSRLVVPFFHSGLDRCIPACLEALNSSDRAQPPEAFLFAVLRWCPPSQRAALLELVVKSAPEASRQVSAALCEATALTQGLSRLTDGESGASSDSGHSLDVDASSFAELLALGDGQSDHGDGVDYSYARAAERLASSASKEEIENFLAARAHMEHSAKVMVAFGRRMLSLGDRTVALHLFDKAEEAALAGHWSQFLGGQKLEVQKLRVELEGDAGREKGFDLLLSELASGQAYVGSLFLNLDVVLEQITVDVPHDAFWIETENHLKQYREYRLAEPIQPVTGINTQSDFLAFIVAKAFDFSCPEILHHARAAAALVARREGSSAFVCKLFELLKQQVDGHREAAALMYRLRAASHLRDVLLSEAKSVVSSEDFVVSNLAERVLLRLGKPPEKPAPTPLPAFYNLVTVESDTASDFSPPPGLSPGHRPVWSDDPWTWTSMLQLPFKALADHSDFSLDLLRRRCADFMRKEGGRSAFGPEIDEAIFTRLKRMELRFAYRRPLPMAAMRAFGKLLQELFRAEAVDIRIFPLVWADIGGPMLSGFHTEPEPRPAWAMLPEFPHRQYGGLEHDEWLADTEDSLYSALVPGHFLLAEESVVKARVRRELAESSRLLLPSPLDLEAAVHGLPRLFSLDDRSPLYKNEESKLVSQIPGDLFGDLGESTMIICPYVARSLGWSRSKTRPLEFADSSDEVVARTVRWVDGTDDIAGYESELFGRGQAVLISETGRVQIEERYGPISCGLKVTRKVNREVGEGGQRTIVAAG